MRIKPPSHSKAVIHELLLALTNVATLAAYFAYCFSFRNIKQKVGQCQIC